MMYLYFILLIMLLCMAYEINKFKLIQVQSLFKTTNNIFIIILLYVTLYSCNKLLFWLLKYYYYYLLFDNMHDNNYDIALIAKKCCIYIITNVDGILYYLIRKKK